MMMRASKHLEQGNEVNEFGVVRVAIPWLRSRECVTCGVKYVTHVSTHYQRGTRRGGGDLDYDCVGRLRANALRLRINRHNTAQRAVDKHAKHIKQGGGRRQQPTRGP